MWVSWTKQQRVIGYGVFAGTLLALIGVRFLVVPDSAAGTFGLSQTLLGHELHAVVGLRDLWLGALAVAFALLREWRALGLWFLAGAAVCFADASIAFGSSGDLRAVAFHLGSGIFCGIVGFVALTLGGGLGRGLGRAPRGGA